MNKKNNFKKLHSDELHQALQKRNDYFDALPPEKKEIALKFQGFIDSELKKAGNQNNRITILHTLLMNYMNELGFESKSLAKVLQELNKNIKDITKNGSLK
ncbi:hypothetical protein [Fluviispira sanaruensis]|uniref:DUF3135 domain-containing protein n=1 Tax=Fluviispira sanaruensis TaxID=2493639 RepID=A0A4V0P2V2_FLUSA|nr:hypothetical protein [Fluviispira sanaruensis]BBH54517.1 hypothetical protein JCM31447_29880 [Fluviispira sanaruensis]